MSTIVERLAHRRGCGFLGGLFVAAADQPFGGHGGADRRVRECIAEAGLRFEH